MNIALTDPVTLNVKVIPTPLVYRVVRNNVRDVGTRYDVYEQVDVLRFTQEDFVSVWPSYGGVGVLLTAEEVGQLGGGN